MVTPTIRRPSKLLLLVLPLTLMAACPVAAQEIDALPINTIFVTSGGFWEDADIQTSSTPAAKTPDTAQAGQSAAESAPARGYYKLVALRQPDRSAKIYLQQIAVGKDGTLSRVANTELPDFLALHPYVTDIRPEDSSGITSQPGFFATVYLKTDPAAREPDSYTVIVDEFGEVQVERATN